MQCVYYIYIYIYVCIYPPEEGVQIITVLGYHMPIVPKSQFSNSNSNSNTNSSNYNHNNDDNNNMYIYIYTMIIYNTMI